MGRPSDKRRRAQRPGRRERSRVKRGSRCEGSGYCGGGAVSYRVKAGRKKWRKVHAYVNRVVQAHLGGESTLKSVRVIERPLYKITLGPRLSGHDGYEPREFQKP
jgi:hypothetical protein